MISFSEAKSKILSDFRPLGSELVSLQSAHGRVLAEDVRARRSQPPADLSAMDGYAVRAADLAKVPCKLKVIEEIPAGAVPKKTLGPGETARIFTGAPLPVGADSILIQENVTQPDLPTIEALETPDKGRYVRAKGIDFGEGDLGIEAGVQLSPRHIALAAAMNYPWLQVRRKPRVAILSTGSELRNPGEPLAPGQIISANSASLAALVQSQGGEVVQLGMVPDDTPALVAALDQAKTCDLIVTSGGASVGAHDLVGNHLKQHGLKVGFWKIAMRPGKPLIYGSYSGTAFLGLPGNPVSSLVGGILIVAPIIAACLGLPDPTQNWQVRRLAKAIPANDQREEFMRAIINPDASVLAFPSQDSSLLSPLAQADGLIRRPAHAPEFAEGTKVDFLPFVPRF